MFQFSGSSLIWLFFSPYHNTVLLYWVPPFGYLRVYGYLLLPAAFRSLSRPSSAPDAKAFFVCSSSLDLVITAFPARLLFATFALSMQLFLFPKKLDYISFFWEPWFLSLSLLETLISQFLLFLGALISQSLPYSWKPWSLSSSFWRSFLVFRSLDIEFS